MSDLGNTAAELFLTKGVPYLGKKAVEMGRYYGSELMRDPKLQQRAINYALNKANPLLHKVGSEALDQLSTKIRPKKKYTTNRKDLDGSGVFSDLFGMTKKVSDVTGKIIGGPTKKTLDDWWSGDLAKRAFSPKTGIFSGHSDSQAFCHPVKWSILNLAYLMEDLGCLEKTMDNPMVLL